MNMKHFEHERASFSTFFSGFSLALLFCLICFRRHCYLFICFSAVLLSLLLLLRLANTYWALTMFQAQFGTSHYLFTLVLTSCIWKIQLLFPFHRWGSRDAEKLRDNKADRWWREASVSGLPGDGVCVLIFVFVFWGLRAACGIVVPWPGIKPRPSAVKVQGPNH